ncbi:MAG: hypothetical protein CL945_05845 [Dinoroseobacter sp.]|nr:hypothetical protein [Dinoroseobacter sp.]MAX72363.1 hypothetical protein [Nioella sp.]|tara:strand:+ start:1131 stop:1952 length:822 start_codon:yes stop_codon:yes gene_type:complete
MTQDAPSISFDINGQTHVLALPAAETDIPSLFVIGLPKAGSTLFNRIMRPICQKAGLALLPWHNMLREFGILPNDFPDTLGKLYQPRGYAFVGFRGLSPKERLPGFANGRTVYLVRDPRDMVVSQYFSLAYSHPPPGTVADDTLLKAFEAERRELRQTSIDEYVLSTAPAVRQKYLETTSALAEIEHRVWRYEDVVFDKLNWISKVVAYLELDVPEAFVANVVARNDIAPQSENKHEHIRKVTPGDHKDKLEAGTVAALNKIFDPILTAHDYR